MGTGKTLASSVNLAASSLFDEPVELENFNVVGRIACGCVCLTVALTSVPEAVVTGMIASCDEFVGLWVPESELDCGTGGRVLVGFRRLSLCGSLSVATRVFRMSLSRCLGKTGAGGMRGAGWVCIELLFKEAR